MKHQRHDPFCDRGAVEPEEDDVVAARRDLLLHRSFRPGAGIGQEQRAVRGRLVSKPLEAGADRQNQR